VKRDRCWAGDAKLSISNILALGRKKKLGWEIGNWRPPTSKCPDKCRLSLWGLAAGGTYLKGILFLEGGVFRGAQEKALSPRVVRRRNPYPATRSPFVT